MADYDVFNGDADGICALIQLRQLESRDSILITGVKRNIQLLSQVNADAGDRIVLNRWWHIVTAHALDGILRQRNTTMTDLH